MCQIISLYKPFWITILGHVLKNYFFGTSNVLAIKSCSQLKKIDLPRNYDFWTVFFKKFQKTFFFKKMFEEIALFPKKIFLKKTHFFKQISNKKTHFFKNFFEENALFQTKKRTFSVHRTFCRRGIDFKWNFYWTLF